MRRIKIEKNVPLPDRQKKYRYVENTIRKMKIGDSIVLHNEQEVNHARAIATILDKKLITRSMQKGEGKRRVWMIKK